MNKQKYGKLIHPEIRIHRQYFREMVKLHGIYVLFRAPKDDKHYTTFGELDSNYEEPILVGCLFDEHPTQKTFKKLGWMSELDGNSSMIHVDYDLEGLQVGALFIIPSGLDDGKGRLFRVVRMMNDMVYPASITCEIVPEYIDNFIEVTNYDEMSGNIAVLNPETAGPVYTEEDILSEEQLKFQGE